MYNTYYHFSIGTRGIIVHHVCLILQMFNALMAVQNIPIL